MLECSIYESLVNLYKELANQQENSNNYEKAIEYLENQLENLNNLSHKIQTQKQKEDNLENQIEVFLKIAYLNFKLKAYTSTLDNLNTLNTLIKDSADSNNVI